MKKVLMSLVVLLLSIIVLHAQNITISTAKRTIIAQPAVTKGYYSIYKNADKLMQRRPLPNITATDNEMDDLQPGKGYYNTNNNHRKLYNSGISFIPLKQQRPVASKGYYNTGHQLPEKKSR